MKFVRRLLIMMFFAGMVAATLSSCVASGKSFSGAAVKQIQIGKTNQDDILALFGRPWRIGMENGQKTWTYGRYRYSVFEDAKASDLIVRFDDNNVVASYSYSTTEF